MARPRIVIVGAGFAGYRTARTLSRQMRHNADVTLLNPTDYFLYLPLLPQVAAGILEPRRVTVSLSGTLPYVRLVLGEADGIDLDGRTVHYTGPEGEGGTLSYDRLVLAAGSVNKLLPIPGVAEHAHGFRGLPEALYLRDHVTRQVELAASEGDPRTCAARCTFVVVGAGYTGTEVAAQGKLFTDAQVRKHPLRKGIRPRWLLLDIAKRVLPELDERLSRTADSVLRERGVDVRMGTSVKEATHDGVLLTDGEFVPTRSLVWCVGVRPDPLADSLGLPMERGRLLVDPHLRVPGRPELFAAGDAAAVPDLENPGQYTPMTAQHAWRQGKVAGRNVAASLGHGERHAYRHRDLGFVVDLGGVKAAANPLGVHLSGPLAGAVTRGYHLAAMPGNRVRVAADWFLDAVLPRQAVQLGLVRSWSVPLDTASPEVARVAGRPEPHDTAARSGPGAATAEDTTTTPAPEPTKGQPDAPEPGKNQPGGEPAKNQPGGEPAAKQPGPEPAKGQPGAPEPGKNQPGGEPDTNQLGGEPAAKQPGPEPAKGQPGAPEPGKNQPGGEPDTNQLGGGPATKQSGPEPARGQPDAPGPAKGQPGGEPARGLSGAPGPAKNQPGGEPAKGQPGGEPAAKQPGPEPAKGRPGAPEPGKNQPGGEPATNQPGGEPATDQPGGEPAKNQPGGEPAKNQPRGEPAKNQPGPEPATGQPGSPGPAQGLGRPGSGAGADGVSVSGAVAGAHGGEPEQGPGTVKRSDASVEGDS
ncbi:FAD-dependent oxidoreductase [Streptomyces gilvus]|uniref:FAD-dependent oxidoreductase n=1 Tax=Streptomyces gilvus TaxID=2920937 RepID=UPI001F0D5E04|nr:FAD-dependent oxidoreductase [Streptomyces sp. CME 23]MCH5670443.1 FAD-dependent oxidoreductase [Streptomyces sp. CME 23]